MPKFRAGGADEFPQRIAAAAERYRLRIEEYQIVTLEPDKYNKTEREQIRFLLDFVALDGDEEAEIVGTDGKPLDPERRVMFFFEPTKMGLKPQVSASRKFLAAALGVPVDQPVEYEEYEDLADDLVGRELIAIVTVTPSGYNKITDTFAARRKKARPRAEREDLVTAAAEVFPDAEVAPETPETPETTETDGDY
jgi:hypothetical protein